MKKRVLSQEFIDMLNKHERSNTVMLMIEIRKDRKEGYVEQLKQISTVSKNVREMTAAFGIDIVENTFNNWKKENEQCPT